MADIEYDDVFVALKVDLLAVDLHAENGGKIQTLILVLKDIKRANLRVDKFIAELREKQLRILLPYLMEMFADFCV